MQIGEMDNRFRFSSLSLSLSISKISLCRIYLSVFRNLRFLFIFLLDALGHVGLFFPRQKNAFINGDANAAIGFC